jgi:hypothetical protein
MTSLDSKKNMKRCTNGTGETQTVGGSNRRVADCSLRFTLQSHQSLRKMALNSWRSSSTGSSSRPHFGGRSYRRDPWSRQAPLQAIKLELKSLDGSLITVQLVAIISHNRPDRVLVRLKGEVKKKHISVGWKFSCFAAHMMEQDLF